MPTRSRPRYDQAFRERTLAELEQSHLPLHIFALASGISPLTLRSWQEQRHEAPLRLLSVTITPPRASTSSCPASGRNHLTTSRPPRPDHQTLPSRPAQHVLGW